MDTIYISYHVDALRTFLHSFLKATHPGDGPLVFPMLQTGLGLQEGKEITEDHSFTEVDPGFKTHQSQHKFCQSLYQLQFRQLQ